MTPLVSLLTPFKNTAAYLAECIESVMHQSYNHWELLMVDDGSTDESYTIAMSYAKKDPRIKVFKNSRQGILDALRLALSHAKGEMVSRMDSDDIMVPQRIETMVNDLLKHGTGHVALGLVKYFPEASVSSGYKIYETWLNDLTRTGSNFKEIYKECVIASPCWMCYTSDLLKCEAFTPNVYPEDYDLTFRFYKYGLKCIPSDTLLHLWRDYPIRTSKTHVHYSLDYFLELKLHYFLELDHEPTRPLVIWGAGQKGKALAKGLESHNIPFYWVSQNPNKEKKSIYSQALIGLKDIGQLHNPQHIISFADANSQKRVYQWMQDRNNQPLTDYFMFC